MLITCGRLITGDEDLCDGWIQVEGDSVSAVGSGRPPGRPDVDLGETTVVPGFVDIHVHGGAGHSFMDLDLSRAAGAAGCHRSHGTTTMLASLVSADVAELAMRVEALSELVGEGILAGVHLEGPWLNPRYKGAHSSQALRTPAAADVDRLLQAGRSAVRMVTLAPELDGGLDAVRRIVDRGCVAAVGHTAATYEVACAALAAGATVGTHLLNAMAPIHHRSPGAAVAILENRSAVAELIVDGVHVHPAMIRSLVGQLGADRTVLVTDAMAAACSDDGHYRLGEADVVVVDGVARLQQGGALAGSTLTMDVAVRNLVLEVGVPLLQAVQAASRNPARVLGLHGVGMLRPGWQADAVALDSDLRVLRTMKRGSWADPIRKGEST